MTTLGELLYGLRVPGQASLQEAYALYRPQVTSGYGLVDFTHDECSLSTFCRNPLHPGPCKGWKRRLGLVAPGALHSLDRAATERREARRKAKVEALVKAGQSVPKRLQTPIVYDPAKNKHLQGPPDLTKDQAKQAIATVPTANDLRKKVDTRRATAATAAARPEARKAADFSEQLLKFLGVDPAKIDKNVLTAQYERMHANGDDAGFQKNAEMLAQKVMDQVEKNSNDKFHGLGASVREQLTKEIKQGLKGENGGTPVLNSVPNGSVDDVLKATRDQRAADLKAKRAATAAKGAATRKANAAKKAGASVATGNMTDQALVNGVKMHGTTTPQGKAAAEELKRRGLDLNGDPLAKSSAPPSASPSAAPSAPAPSTPTPAAPLPSGASAAAKHAQAVASRSAPGARLSKTHADAYAKLSKDDFDALPDATRKQITDDLIKAHGKFVDKKKKDDVAATFERHTRKMVSDGGPAALSPTNAPATPSAQTPNAPAVSAPAAPSAPSPSSAPAAPAAPAASPYSSRSTAGQLQALRGEKDPHEIYKRWTLLSLRDKNDPDAAKEREATRKHFEADTSQPLWLRGKMATDDPSFDRSGLSLATSSAIMAATSPTSPGGRYFATSSDLEHIMRIPKADQDALPKVLHDAVVDRRNEAVNSFFGPSSSATFDAKTTALKTILGPEPWRNGIDKDRVGLLSPVAQTRVRNGLIERVAALANNNRYEEASNWQTAEDELGGKTLDPKVERALNKAKVSWLTANEHLDGMETIDRNTWLGTSGVHQKYLEQRLTQIAVANAHSPDVARRARHILAEWTGNNVDRKRYSPTQLGAAHAATTDVGDDDAATRALAYSQLTQNEIQGMSRSDRAAVLKDLRDIADDSNNTWVMRYRMQQQHDKLDPASIVPLLGDKMIAIKASDPSVHPNTSVGHKPPQDRIDAYSKLSRSDFNSLPSAYQKSILTDVDGEIKAWDPIAHDKLMTEFDPKYAASKATPNVTSLVGPASQSIKDALDIVYGVDPKAKTAPRQLSVYSKVRKVEFDKLQPQEQSTILGDLAYIASTSKSAATKKRANDAMYHLSPAGTPYGTIPNQPISVPSNAVAGQTRIADPRGVAGSLKKSPNPGQSGDGWFRSPNGRQVWGKYGAAGLLLRHVDQQSGEERYLMVQRGPGISDPGKWQFPGGAIDSKESFHEGAAREVIEELGFKDNDLLAARVHGEHSSSIPGGWSYVSIAATVDKQIQADLSTHHARQETADAKWMTLAEIKALDTKGKLLAPLAGGQLETNVVSLFPSGQAGPVLAPGKRPARLIGTPTLPKPSAPHKPSLGKDLITDPNARDQLRQDVKQARSRFAGKTADDRLAAIGEIQGYDAAPTVVTKADMDRLLATGDYIEAWRGVKGKGSQRLWGSGRGGAAVSSSKTAAEIQEEFRSGPAFYGLGVYGNGYYLARDKRIAQQYSDGSKNSVMRILIPKKAATKKYRELTKHRDSIGIPYSSKAKGKNEIATLHDPGRYAAALGIDGIEITTSTASHLGTGAFNWVNRSVLIVQEAE